MPVRAGHIDPVCHASHRGRGRARIEADRADGHKLGQPLPGALRAIDSGDLRHAALTVYRPEHRERMSIDDDLALGVKLAQPLEQPRHRFVRSLDHPLPPEERKSVMYAANRLVSARVEARAIAPP
jgi:hypothetical protein